MKTLLLKAGVAATPIVLAAASPAAAADRRGGGIQSVAPNSQAVPGGEQASTLISGVMWFGLAAAVAALIAGAGLMGWGKFRNNHKHADMGGTVVGVSLGGAFLIGCAFVLVNYAFRLGASVSG